MNKETIRGDWNLIKGKIIEKWGELTSDDLSEIHGKKDQLVGLLQKKYGLAKEKAEAELADWEKHKDEEEQAKKDFESTKENLGHTSSSKH